MASSLCLTFTATTDRDVVKEPCFLECVDSPAEYGETGTSRFLEVGSHELFYEDDGKENRRPEVIWYKGFFRTGEDANQLPVCVKFCKDSDSSLVAEAQHYAAIRAKMGDSSKIAKYYGLFRGTITFPNYVFFGPGERSSYCLVFGNADFDILSWRDIRKQRQRDKIRILNLIAWVHKAGVLPASLEEHIAVQHDKGLYKLIGLHTAEEHQCEANYPTDFGVGGPPPSSEAIGCDELWSTCQSIGGLWRSDVLWIGAYRFDKDNMPSQRVIDELMPACIDLKTCDPTTILAEYFADMANDIGPDEDTYIEANKAKRTSNFLNYLPEALDPVVEMGLFGDVGGLEEARNEFLG